MVVHGIRLLLEQRDGFCIVKIDLRNAFNSVSRSGMLRRLRRHPRLAHLCPLLHALLSCETELRVGHDRRCLFEDEPRVGSSEGTQQGMPQSMLAFCVAIQPELEALDRELGCVGGCARAIADDVMAVGPAQVVFPAVLHFLSALRESVGLEAQLAKFQCWSSSYDLASCPYRSRAGVPVSFVASPESGARMHGVMVGGVPLGEPAYVRHVLAELSAEIVSYVSSTMDDGAAPV